jgi:hypothetical protein
MDNLRSTLVVFVISMHAADTYSPLGNWYFTDRTPLSTSVLLFFAARQMFLQAFFMGLLFFIAGLFVPGSLDRKGPLRFARERLWRLLLTWPYETFRRREPRRRGRPCHRREPVAAADLATAADPRATAWHDNPGLLCAHHGWGRLSLIRACRLSVVLNMHLGDFAQYILMFAAGIFASRRQWLAKLSFQQGMTWLVLVTKAGRAAWLAMIVMGGALEGHTDCYSGGWHWQSAT